MSKHTPGPWRVTDCGVRAHGGYIAHTNSVMRYPDQEERYAFEVAQRDADKRLIAAAPDLLEALEDLESDIAGRFDMEDPSTNPGIKFAIEAARAAIAKARGDL